MEWDGVDRRREVRRSFPFTVHIHAAGKLPISTYTADISEGGIRVVINKELEVASVVELQIYTKKDIVTCKGVVSRLEKKENEVVKGEVFFDAGIEFQNLKEEDKLIVKSCVAESTKGKNKT